MSIIHDIYELCYRLQIELFASDKQSRRGKKLYRILTKANRRKERHIKRTGRMASFNRRSGKWE